MTTSTSTLALRFTLAQGAFDRGDYLTASRDLAELVAEAERSDVGHALTDLRLLLSRAYYHSAQLGRAERTLQRVVQEDPTDGYAHLLLGRTLQRAGRHEEAKRALALAQVLGDYERPSAQAAPAVVTDSPAAGVTARPADDVA